MTGMTTDYAIAILRRMQEPEPFEPQINESAFDALEMAIQAIQKYATWSQTYSNMVEDTISRKAAIEAVRETFKRNPTTAIRAMETIRALPSAQPEAKPPKWVAEDRYVKNKFMVFPHCPQCNAEVTTGQCYCMICGQHIDWSEDDG